MTTTTATASEILSTMGGVDGCPVKFMAMYGGYKWFARKTIDHVYLVRPCTCADVPGRHSVERVLTIAEIAESEACTQRLRGLNDETLADMIASREAAAFMIIS